MLFPSKKKFKLLLSRIIHAFDISTAIFSKTVVAFNEFRLIRKLTIFCPSFGAHKGTTLVVQIAFSVPRIHPWNDCSSILSMAILKSAWSSIPKGIEIDNLKRNCRFPSNEFVPTISSMAVKIRLTKNGRREIE